MLAHKHRDFIMECDAFQYQLSSDNEEKTTERIVLRHFFTNDTYQFHNQVIDGKVELVLNNTSQNR